MRAATAGVPAPATARASGRPLGRPRAIHGRAGVAAVANLAFKKGLRSQQVMEAVEAVEVKVAEVLRPRPSRYCPLQQERVSHALK
jgi:hypothetical protein